jgi:four helix bundle protein
MKKRNVISELSIKFALKEADETEYWLTLLFLSNIISESHSIQGDLDVIIGTLVNIIKKVKEQ